MHQLSSISKPAGYCSACSNKLDFYRTWPSHIHTKHLSAKNEEIEKGPENQVLLFVARPGIQKSLFIFLNSYHFLLFTYGRERDSMNFR